MTMYFIAVVLPGALNQKILPLKELMRDRFGCMVGLKSPAHLTLVPPFWMHPDKEEALRAELTRIQAAPFTLHTAGFSAFRPRTIFIAVDESKLLQDLKHSVDLHFPANNPFGAKADTRPYHPHITIATRDLHKKDFQEAWPEFEERTFDETFPVDSIALLRHNGQRWEVVFEAPLMER